MALTMLPISPGADSVFALRVSASSLTDSTHFLAVTVRLGVIT
uniref:Uncharacterized protein n=1 Tax=Arundo donax TaxID=35708 RepID=A0A0A9C5U1_ARUDO